MKRFSRLLKRFSRLLKRFSRLLERFSRLLKRFSRLLPALMAAKAVCMIPLSRYVTKPCCSNVEHITNRLEQDFGYTYCGRAQRPALH